MEFWYKEDLILVDYNFSETDNYLKFIKIKHDGDYSIKHQMEVSKGKTYLWQGLLSSEVREKFINRLAESHGFDPFDDSANRIWRILLSEYGIELISAPNKMFPECADMDPSKITFENMENPIKVCKHCGNLFMPDYDFIEDETVGEHLNMMFGGTYEYPATWPDYCTTCLLELFKLDTAKDTYSYFKETDVIKGEN